MPYRPVSTARKKTVRVIYPLTDAVRRRYGVRESDGAYPIGAVYSKNVSRDLWRHAGGIWYVPAVEERILEREVDDSVVAAFLESMVSGVACELPTGEVIEWEPIPEPQANALPPRLD